MKYFFLHIIFLCCAVLGYGQEKFPFLISYNGESVPFTISIEDNAVSKNNFNTITVNKDSLENNLFEIHLEADEEFLVKCSSSNLQEIICQDKITTGSGFDAKVLNPSNGSSVTFKILSPDGNTELVVHTINIQLITTLKKESETATTSNDTISTNESTTTTSKVKPTSVTDPCVGKRYGERLQCLRKLDETSKINTEINSLNSEKREIEEELNSFKKESLGTNVYKITCACDISQYNISASNSSVQSRSSYWKITNLSEASNVIVKHKSWKSLYKNLRFTYVKPKGKKVEKEKETETEKTPKEEETPPKDTVKSPAISTQQKIDTISTESKLIVEPTISEFDIKEYWWLALIALPILFLLMRGLNKSEPNESESENIKETPIMDTSKQTETTQVKTTDEIPEIQIQEVKKSAEQALAKIPLAELEKSEDFVLIDLEKCWKNTSVSKIFFGKKSIREIAEMVGTQNAYDPDKQSAEELSEIGGFLLGHFYPQKKGKYYVSISTFVPITPEVNNRYTVKFGDEAWVELDDAYKNNPGERLVGWFHTHPGHGLFLSNADIKVHTEAFSEKYQFAMEIDPTTPGCDTAFFTWKKDNTLNNQKDRIPARWDRLKVLELHLKEK